MELVGVTRRKKRSTKLDRLLCDITAHGVTPNPGRNTAVELYCANCHDVGIE
jgi:hypothetical protein